ncbi:MAG: flagellar motor switch protein FliG [Magnetococcales bacterium]|nr:flagellar motor switch protein FliG [Magnetococcales bacterium]
MPGPVVAGALCGVDSWWSGLCMDMQGWDGGDAVEAQTRRTKLRLSGKEKAGVFILSLPDEDAKKIMEGMLENELREISRVISRMGVMAPEVVQAVRQEFLDKFELKMYDVRGGQARVRELLTKTLGKDRARQLLKDVQAGPKSTPWEILNTMEPTLVSTFLAGEHPQSVALIISQLQQEHAALVIDHLSTDLQQQTVYRMARMNTLPPGALEDIELSLLTELDALGVARSGRQQEAGGTKKVAELLNLLSRDLSDKLLAFLDEEDNPLAESVRKEMFLFEDLLLMDDRSFQTLLREVSNDELLTAMKGADDRLREKFFQNMSERAAEMLREDLELLGPVKVVDVEAAQQMILKAARRLEAEGSIVIMGKGSDDVVM